MTEREAALWGEAIAEYVKAAMELARAMDAKTLADERLLAARAKYERMVAANAKPHNGPVWDGITDDTAAIQNRF